MTLKELIEELQDLADRYGDDAEVVVFDNDTVDGRFIRRVNSTGWSFRISGISNGGPNAVIYVGDQ
jgi:hypothetical protein